MIDFEKYKGDDAPDVLFRVCARANTPDGMTEDEVKFFAIVMGLAIPDNEIRNCDHCGHDVLYDTAQPVDKPEDFILCSECYVENVGDEGIWLPNNNHPQDHEEEP
jgi:hypothetical protein